MLNVKQYQIGLRVYGYFYKGDIDGKAGSKTKAAIKDYQKSQKLAPDGIYGPKTDKALVSNIKAVQAKVGDKKTGIINSITVGKITNWQKVKGYRTNGVLTLDQIKVMFSTSNNPFKSTYFKIAEFKCGCNGRYCNGYPAGKTMDAKLVKILDGLRSHYGQPIIVTSGQRCKKYNASLPGSVSTSAHLKGKAADIYIAGGICSTANGRNQVKNLAYKLGAKYSYCNTKGMGNAVHINV